MVFRPARLPQYVVAAIALLLPLTMPATALAHARPHPAPFALSPADFPAGSQVVRAGVDILHPTHTLAAGSPRIASSLYPAHTRITILAPLSNQQMDCDWGFACHDGQAVTSAPVFHLRTQDDLHRLSGWAQFGDTRGRSTRMLFALIASRYSPESEEGMPWNVVAFSDFRGAALSTGFRDLDRTPRLLPQGMLGNASVQIVRSASEDVLAVACWTGSAEVEGVVVYAHGDRAARTTARRDLIHRVRSAVGQIVLG